MDSKVLLILIAAISIAFSQKGLLVREVTSEQLQFVNLIIEFHSKHVSAFYVNIFLIANEPGSLGGEESHEVTHSILIGISEYDEYPEQSIFEVGEFANPQISQVIEVDNNVQIRIAHGFYGQSKTSTILVKLHEVEVLE